MRDLTQEERRLVFEKLAKFLGPNLKLLIERPDDEPHVFRLHRERIYYMSENVLKKALHIKRKQLLCAGVCLAFSVGGLLYSRIPEHAESRRV